MTKKQARNVRSSRQPRRPTAKQVTFAAAYLDPQGANGNGVAAARKAGYRGNCRQLATQASVNLRNANVQEMIATKLDANLEHSLQRLLEAMDATKTRSMLSKEGAIVRTDPEPDHRIRLEAVEFFFHLRSKITSVNPVQPAEVNYASDAMTREEAIEAAKECLETFAPRLLAETVVDVGPQNEQPAAAGNQEEVSQPAPGEEV